MNELTQQFKTLLKTSKKILLVNHRRMDGDALWSLAAFYYLLNEIWWYEIKAINEELIPKWFDFLKKQSIFDENTDIKDFSPDLIISFDVASLVQLWNIYEKNIETFYNTPFVNIDHHSSNPMFWTLNLIDSSSCSACEVVYDLIIKLWYEKFINEEIATMLLMWIITDTNNFINTNTTPKSLEIASNLMKISTRHQDLILNLFKRKNYNKIKLWWKILENLKDINNSKVVRWLVPKSYFIETQTDDKDISWFIDEFLMTVDGLKVWFLIYELPDKKLKASFRSKTDDIDLSLFCEEFWWWWHKRASGFVFEWKNINELEFEIISKLTQINL